MADRYSNAIEDFRDRVTAGDDLDSAISFAADHNDLSREVFKARLSRFGDPKDIFSELRAQTRRQRRNCDLQKAVERFCAKNQLFLSYSDKNEPELIAYLGRHFDQLDSVDVAFAEKAYAAFRSTQIKSWLNGKAAIAPYP